MNPTARLTALARTLAAFTADRTPHAVTVLIIARGADATVKICETGETMPLAEYERRKADGLVVMFEARTVLEDDGPPPAPRSLAALRPA